MTIFNDFVSYKEVNIADIKKAINSWAKKDKLSKEKEKQLAASKDIEELFRYHILPIRFEVDKFIKKYNIYLSAEKYFAAIQYAVSGWLEAASSFKPKGARLMTYANKFIYNKLVEFLRNECIYMPLLPDWARKMPKYDGFSVCSLNRPIGQNDDEDSPEVVDFVESYRKEYSPEDCILKSEYLTALAKALKELPPRQSQVISLYFGLNGEKPHYQNEIALLLNISPQAVNCAYIAGLKNLGRLLSEYADLVTAA